MTAVAAPALMSPTLADACRRYDAARGRARALLEGLDDAAFHRAPPGGGWSVAECLEHLVIAGSKMNTRLEEATSTARAAGRIASADVARQSLQPDWISRFFLLATGAAKDGARPGLRVAVRPVFDPADPRGRGRDRDAVLADFLALQDRLERTAHAADGLDLAGIKVASLISDWLRLPLGMWFVSLAGHQERHLDQAARIRAAATTGDAR